MGRAAFAGVIVLGLLLAGVAFNGGRYGIDQVAGQPRPVPEAEAGGSTPGTPSRGSSPAPSAGGVQPGSSPGARAAGLPPGRRDAAMAFDAARGVTVLFGGASASAQLGDTWTWDGNAWAKREPGSAPAARDSAAITYDSARAEVLLFGGRVGQSLGADTWTWSGRDWTRRQPAHAPPARAGALLAYYPASGAAILFGGVGIGGELADTWEWSGNDWLALPAAGRPELSSPGAAMAYDARQARLLASGAASGRAVGWSFIAGRWSAIADPPAGFPAAFAGAAYANDVNSILLFGGEVGGAVSPDLWAFDGQSWQKREAPSAPPGRAHTAVAYDGQRAALVVFGGAGADATPLADTWTWTAKSGWKQAA